MYLRSHAKKDVAPYAAPARQKDYSGLPPAYTFVGNGEDKERQGDYWLNNEIVLFTDGDVNIEVQINPEEETVWLTQKQMGELFGVKQATLSEHINNIIMSGELDETSIGFSDKSTGGRRPKIYNLDMILSVGYRVNSKRGIAFRKWKSSRNNSSSISKYIWTGCISIFGG